jgi:DNA polymerase-1
MLHRTLSKLNSTYTLSLIAQVNPDTGRIHTSYNQALTSTGRLSSSNPNLQNIPIKTVEGRRIRQAFIAKPGYVLMAADYSQIELRLMAHFSKDETLLNAFKQGEDIHKATASEVFQMPLQEVTTEQRRSAKAINFGLIYGMGAFGLAKQLGISRTDAQAYIARYFGRFSGVLAYMDQAKNDAKNKGYVETLLGRRLYLPDINSSVAMVRAGAERIAINAPLQGTAADIIKLAMIKVDQALLEINKSELTLDAQVLLQVHDELVLEVKKEHVDATKALLQSAMTTAFTLDVPLDIEIGIGFDWDEAH